MPLVLALGLFVRLWLFGEIPGGVNQDEAFAAWEAWSILESGKDSAGYAFPVYLTAWGSGMNALESYLMLPFIAVFGLETWAIRLPQLITGLLSLWVMYLLARDMLGRRMGLWCLFMLAICPWHVLLCRWGLESNLAPGFMLFGLYFFYRGLSDGRFFLLSGLMYGLSLYAYATIWPFVPFIILAQLLYCLGKGRLKADRWLLAGALPLGLLALPLLLFLGVNWGLMEEICLPFMSIPKLLYFRSGELGLENAGKNLLGLFRLLLRQSDGLPWNYAGAYGLLYPVSLPFALWGIGAGIRGLFRKEFRPEALFLFQLFGGLLLGALISVNVNRVNIIFPPLVFFTALGLCRLGQMLGRAFLPAAALVYGLLFLGFCSYYFTDYREIMDRQFGQGLEEAVDFCLERGEEDIRLSGDISWPKVLFCSAMDPDGFRSSVSYSNYPAAFLSASAFGPFRWGFEPETPEEGAVYVISPGTELAGFEERGFQLRSFGIYSVAYK